MPLIRDKRYTSVRVWCNAVLTGYTFRDKCTIFVNRALHLSYPLGRFFNTFFKIHIFSPNWIIKKFYCRNKFGIFLCPGGSTELEFTKFWEPSVTKLIQSLKKGTFVDVGGNVGLYTVMASKLLGKNGRVISIEPDPDIFKVLEQNVKNNSCQNVELKNIAAWNKQEKLKLYKPKFGVDTVGNSLVQNSHDYYFEVNAMSLDDVLDDPDIVLIKVDVEGAEPQVWKGLHKTLSCNDSIHLVFEALEDEELKKSTDILDQYNFKYEKLFDGNYHAYKNNKTLNPV